MAIDKEADYESMPKWLLNVLSVIFVIPGMIYEMGEMWREVLDELERRAAEIEAGR